MNIANKLRLVASEGEGQSIEFKQAVSHLDKEMVAFANAMGGSVFVGIDDQGTVTGIKPTNRLISQIQDIARNCDPPIKIKIEKLDNVLEIIVHESVNKPHRCQGGFYLRSGPNSQKLTRDEIISFAIGEGRVRFDEQFNNAFDFDQDFSHEEFETFSQRAHLPANFKPQDILINLNIAQQQKGALLFSNAGVLFFAVNPQKFFSESYVTCVRYRGLDRSSIIDRKDIKGPLMVQLQESINFFKRHTEEAIVVSDHLAHQVKAEYPLVAVREALVNAVMHRDYLYDGSHIYMHIFSDRIEIENPGGLFKGLLIDDLGKRSVRRNRIIADLFFRVGFVEMIGSGIHRMFEAMSKNGNPPPEISATNFFSIIFKKSLNSVSAVLLSDRQKQLFHFILTRQGSCSKAECARFLNMSGDTALRELRRLIKLNLVKQTGQGKSVRYSNKS